MSDPAYDDDSLLESVEEIIGQEGFKYLDDFYRLITLEEEEEEYF